MKVRSAIATMLALGLLGAAAPTALAQAEDEASVAEPAVTIAMLPRGTGPAEIARISPRLGVGVLSAGLGSVPADQTYLDIGQGNRLFNSLYPDPAPPLYVTKSRVPERFWSAALERAADAPADIVPGLLADSLIDEGIPVGAAPSAREAALIAVDSAGSVPNRAECPGAACPGLAIATVAPEEVPSLLADTGAGELLILLERPPPVGRLLSVGIAGDGYEGILTSPTTRIDGYVLSTDLAPTILDHFGIETPDEMSGRLIESRPAAAGDLEDLTSLSDRLEDLSDRRSPVIGTNLLIWLALVALVSLIARGRGARIALPALATAIAWIPALTLLTAALEPSVTAERLIVGIGAPLLALLSLAVLSGSLGRGRAIYAAFAIAAAVSITATAIDVLGGSTFTSLSLLGPNPGLGVRFFGIGNELEATIGVMLALGSGAAVSSAAPADPRRAVTIVMVVATLAAVVVFAPGRWGADVGAAITFPAAAAGVALAALGLGRRRLMLFIAAPILGLAALIAIDLVMGGDAHLSRSVLDAGGLDGLGEVLERRIRLSAASFERFIDTWSYMLAGVAIIAGVIARKQILGWLDPFPAARAGFIGAVVGSVVGALANDSGSLLLLVGAAFCAAFAGLAWSAQYFTSDSDSG
jgi:hypothetical protein